MFPKFTYTKDKEITHLVTWQRVLDGTTINQTVSAAINVSRQTAPGTRKRLGNSTANECDWSTDDRSRTDSGGSSPGPGDMLHRKNGST